MIGRKKRLVFVYLALLVVLGLAANLCLAQSSSPIKFDAERLPWRRLSFKADNFFGKVATDVRLETMSAKEAADLLLAVPQAEGLQPSGATVIAITVDSNIDPMIGPNEILNTQSLFNPGDGAVLQRLRLRHGGKVWQKSYRFLSNGVYHQRKRPSGKKQPELPPNQWKTFETRWYPYNGSYPECRPVLEASEFLYLASVVGFTQQKDPLSLCVFNKKQLHRVTVSAGEAGRLKVNYLERLPAKQIRREGSIQVVKISFQPRGLDAGNKDFEEFSFLGLQGDFEIYVDATARIPVQVSGQIPGIGKLDIRLDEAAF